MIKSTLNSPIYADRLFGSDIIEINIETDKDNWQNMFDTAVSESYTTCDVTVNGTTFSSVGIRPKGRK